MSIKAATYAAKPHEMKEQRLASLQHTQLLDSTPSQRFDAITNLVADVFQTPIALVSLIDSKRQWFLSNCGLSASQTSRDVAFCAHAIHEDEILVIEDTRNDVVFKDSPLVVGEPFIQFYAGAVIRDDNVLPLGTLCIIDKKPRRFEKKEQRLLIKFAKLIRQEIIGSDEITEARTKSTFRVNKDPITNTLWGDSFFESVELYRDTQKNESNCITLRAEITNLESLNNTYGRVVGDQVIWEISRRLSHNIKEFGHTIVGRLKAKELVVFSVLDKELSSQEIDKKLAQMVSVIGKVISTPIGDIQPQVSIGYKTEQSNNYLFRDSVKQTQLIMSQLKVKMPGVNIYKVTKEAQDSIARKFEIGRELTNAIHDDALHLMYQPKVDTQTGELVGLECLLRWQHTRYGAISPLDIFECAHNTNNTFYLETWVFKEAFKQTQKWKKAGFTIPKISINLTGETLTNPQFYDTLTKCLHEHQLSASYFDIEILESSVFHDKTLALAAIQRINDAGLSFSLDDFGTGFSNLSYLKTMPITSLKIDISFVRDITQDLGSAALCNSIVSMAKDLGMQSVAEGVETEAQLNMLKKMGCNIIQGYYFYKPLSAEKAESLLIQHRSN